MDIVDHGTYCADQVRRFDRDRYLTAIFAPAARRQSLLALYAFNLEIAKTRESVSEPMLGQIRLQWWREALDEIYRGTVRQHQIVSALADAILRHDLPHSIFSRLIDAREFDLTDDYFEDMAALEAYAEATSSAVMTLALKILDDDTSDAGDAALHGGIAWSIIGMIRALKFHLQQRRVFIPRTVLALSGLTGEKLFTAKPPPELQDAAAALAATARARLERTRRHRRAIQRDSLAALLPLTLASANLSRIEKARFDVFGARIELNPVMRQMRLLAAVAAGRF